MTANASLDAVRMATELNLLEGKKSINFFFTDIKFCKWLASCVVNQVPSDVVDEFHKKYAPICLFHFPENAEFTSFMVTPITAVDSQYLASKKIILHREASFDAVYYFNEQDNACYDVKKFDHQSNEWEGVTTEEDKSNNKKHFRIYAGLCLYLECFPDMVKDGIPFDFDMAFDYNMSEPKTIEVSDRVTYTEHDSPCAHYRNGHFRTLRSERFVNKRYQVVFVHGCFVKGEAKTVLNPNENNEVIK
jgi:hypothetical protein